MQLMTRSVFGFAVAALLAPTICAAPHRQETATAAPPAGTKHSVARKLTRDGVPNFGEVTPTLYRGAQPSKEGFANLAKMGIGIVVDLRGSRDSERKEVTKLGMHYVAMPWKCYRPRDADFAQFLTLLRENPGKKVFVHCFTGDDRTGMDIAAYRMAEQGWTAQEARTEMEAYGFSWFHRMICPGLADYEKKFPQDFRSNPSFKNLRPREQASTPKP